MMRVNEEGEEKFMSCGENGEEGCWDWIWDL